MRLHLLVVDRASGDGEALLRELKRAGFAPSLRRADDAQQASRTLADVVASTPRTDDGLAIDVIEIGPASGEGPSIDAQTAEALEAAQVALARSLDQRDLREANRIAVRTLRESEERHRALIEQSAFGLWQIGADGRTLYVNPAMCAMLEIADVAEMGGRDPRGFFPGDGLARIETAEHEEDRSRCIEVEVLGAKGGRRRAICIASVVVASKGERSTLRTFTDVTELRRVQEQSQQAQKLEAIGRLAGGIAHDFNNLLTVVFTCCGLLQRRIAVTDPARAHIDQIESAVKRGAALTRQVLAFARQHPVEPTSVDVNDVVNKMTSMLRHVIGDDIELRVNTDRNLRPIRADRGQIEQVLMNLALNARDAMPRGGKLVVSTANVELGHGEALQLDVQPGSYVLVAVSDTGVGMDEETRARIFEPFFTTKAGKGTGLGLATVFGIAREGGGAVAVESAPGKGATFRIWMPVAKEEASVTTTTSHPRVVARGSETVLLVDDEENIRGPLAEFLRIHGFTVLEARNGVDAMEHAKRHEGEIDVLVTDVVMPRMGGKSLADALLALRPKMKVLYLTGYSESTIIRRGHIEVGVSLLQKPFPPEALVSRIHDLVAGNPAPPG